jgi:hypothetical protein
MPDPIIPPTTSAVAVQNPKGLLSVVSIARLPSGRSKACCASRRHWSFSVDLR